MSLMPPIGDTYNNELHKRASRKELGRSSLNSGKLREKVGFC